MPIQGPKRTYSPRSLEFWFGHLPTHWEESFTSAALTRGRDFYREGVIREIELSEGQAIVHVKHEGRELYSVVDAESDGRLAFRSCAEDPVLGMAIAAAGLYEIEELIADEIPPVSSEGEDVDEEDDDEDEAEETERETSHPRPLHLRFFSNARGLNFEAFWDDGEDRRSKAVLHGNNGSGAHNSREREILIRLASFAHKAQFKYLQEAHVYSLSEMARLPSFLRDDIHLWKKYFQIDLTEDLQSLNEGVKDVDVEAIAEVRDDGRLNMRWVFKSGEALLKTRQAQKLLSGEGEPVLLPGVGLVTLAPEKARTVQRLRHTLHERFRLDENRFYLLLSFFEKEDQIDLKLAPQIKAWKKSLSTNPPEFKLPDFLRRYQKNGVEWLAHLCDHHCHGLLADEMGLGKTIQTIALLASRPVKEEQQLIVGPASVVPVWEAEIKKFYPDLPVHVLRSGNDFVSNPAPGIWIASYTQLRRNRELLRRRDFGYAVLDEGQLIKNPEAKVTQACFTIRARHRIVLTGTPLENRHLDIWSLFRFLMPGFLGTRAVFEDMINENRGAFMKQLRTQLAPFILRRTKKNVAKELPKKIEMELSAPFTAVQRSEYARICREGISRLGDNLSSTLRSNSFGLFALLTRLRQVSCDPDLLPWKKCELEESGKITLLMEKLPEIVESGHKVVIFSQFVRLLERVSQAAHNHLQEIPQFTLVGSTRDREKPVKQFQQHKGPALMLVSLKAGGTGITLHAADYVFLLDPWWNPAVEEQAIDRVHRIGQKNTVFVYRMTTSGTIEEKIQALKARKKDLFDSLLGPMEDGLSIGHHFESLSRLIEIPENK
ncbi:MAG: DEAD/DEAH box helicase [Opitutales bacterium]|nr:DEAD/DEAH box helicase [Opitutales bacterium]